MNWPLQSEASNFYGARMHIESKLVSVGFPFPVTYEGKPVRSCRIHPKCADSLHRVLENVYAEYRALFGSEQDALATMALHGVTIYSGSYNNRMMRGNPRAVSMHAYGCAIDFDAEHNPRGKPGRFTSGSKLVKAFKAEGWVWGGDWDGSSCDPMHFQAARVISS